MKDNVLKYINWYGNYAKTLKFLRVYHKYTKAHVGREINRAASTVANHESGMTEPDLHTIALYCDLYGLELYEFFHLLAHIEGGVLPSKQYNIKKLALSYMLIKDKL